LENNTTYALKDGRVEAPGESQKLIDQFDEVYQPHIALMTTIKETSKSGDQAALLALVLPRINELKTGGEHLSGLLQANADSEIAAYYIYARSLLQEEKDLKSLKPAYDLLGEKAKASIYGKALQPRMDAITATTDNDPRMVDYARTRQSLVEARKDLFYNVYVPYLNPKAGEKKGLVAEGIGIVTRIDKADADIKAFTKQYVEQHRDEMTAALAFSESLGYSIGYFTVSEIDALISLLSTAVKASTEGKNLFALADLVKRSAVGAKFTDFTLNDPGGNPVRLSDHVGKGKYVLLEF
jgi:hypothetical protein